MKTSDELSERAREVSKLCNLGLEHPFEAHQAHEQAAAAHNNNAIGQDAERHKKLADEHRRAAQYWANKETNPIGVIRSPWKRN